MKNEKDARSEKIQQIHLELVRKKQTYNNSVGKHSKLLGRLRYARISLEWTFLISTVFFIRRI